MACVSINLDINTLRTSHTNRKREKTAPKTASIPLEKHLKGLKKVYLKILTD
jgi:hypothetical protein